MKQFRFWCERPLPEEHAELLSDEAVVIGTSKDQPDEPLVALPEAQAVIAGPRISYNGAFMNRASGLKVITRTGIGYDNVVIADATERKIAICNTPDAPTLSTAEHTITLILAVAKQVKKNDRDLRRGESTDFLNANNGIEIYGKTLGLVGLGRIGSTVARMAQALGMNVMGLDPYVSEEKMGEIGVVAAGNLETLLRNSDVVSLHVPHTDETYQMINVERLALMKPGSILINAARGALVDESALLAALQSEYLHGAGLDAFYPEPPDPNNPLLNRDDVIATPHIGAATREGKQRLWSLAIAQCLEVLRGERPANLINPEIWNESPR